MDWVSKEHQREAKIYKGFGYSTTPASEASTRQEQGLRSAGFLGRVDRHLLEYLSAEIYDFKDKSKFGKLLSKDTGAALLATERVIMRQ
ncbi:hypothetical protein BOTCAL_0522g00020 [Botryotinia calthae]|uniref:Uncharacterized protein n=1 Tax=Botryotinia calthae TaxID=38488 RepID=A0A4Y8CKR0_9HELO|nr:hypothetical protein BOTCAL_0522g00020 [Botryotinia calthae]